MCTADQIRVIAIGVCPRQRTGNAQRIELGSDKDRAPRATGADMGQTLRQIFIERIYLHSD
jgi:hypothetical protein